MFTFHLDSHFSVKQQCVLATKTQLPSCQGTKPELSDFHSANQETNSLIRSLHQPLNNRKCLPNASKPWSLSLYTTFQLWLLYTAQNELDRREREEKNSQNPFIVFTGKSADYCNRTKHLFGFYLLDSFMSVKRLKCQAVQLPFFPFCSFIYLFIFTFVSSRSKHTPADGHHCQVQ